MGIRYLDCLTSEECESIRKRVHSLKQHWVARIDEKIPFYTLGAASYLDAEGKKESRYKGIAKRMNPILESHFSDLYARLSEVITHATSQKVEYDKLLALPGFHIFLFSELFTQPLASKHFDLQFKLIDWARYQNIDFENPISFTLSITLPASGGGMYCWDLIYNPEVGRHSREEEKEESKTFIEYFPGKLVLHEGFMLHQIAPVKEMNPTDERITLQGHGLICDGVMRLYW
jgi:hypothetical protein